MLIANNDEEKRSQIWRIVTVAATITIILIAGFFAIKMYTDNPLIGKWTHQGSELTMDIQKSEIIIYDGELVPNQIATYSMNYELNRDAKTIHLTVGNGEISKVEKELGDMATETAVQESMQSMETTYGYSLDGDELTLTDQEYGEQMVFDKQ